MAHTFRKRGEDYPLTRMMPALPGQYYHDVDIYQRELDRIFYRQWQFACREEQIPGAGDYVNYQIGDESILIVRTADQRVKAYFNVCRHRGTRMCTESAGHFKGNHIQCPYHAWTYDLNGALVSAPLQRDVIESADFTLYPAAVHVWEGFVFVNLADDPEPFEGPLGALAGRFTDWCMSDLRIAHEIIYELNCNWKLIFHNYQECYHCPGVHPWLSELTPFDSARHDCMDGAVIGGFMDLTTPGGSMTMDGRSAGPTIGEVNGEDLQRVYYYTVFPNLLLTPHPDFVLYHQIIPNGPDKITNVCRWLYHPDVIADPQHAGRIRSAVEFWDLTNRQDWTVCEQMQLGTRSRRFTEGVYMAQEDVLYALDQSYLKIMNDK